MHEHGTRRETGSSKPSAPRRTARAQDPAAAGNRAMVDLLGPRPVQRWPDLGDIGGYLPEMPSLPDLGGMVPSMPSMPDLGSLVPSIPRPNIPGVNLNIDTDAGTASGGIDFHDGTSGQASYGPGGLDVSGQSGTTRGAGHVSAGNDWNFSGATTTRGGTSLGGSLGDDHGQFSGSASGAGPGGDSASLAGYGGSKGYGGMGTYDGQYGDLNLGF